MGANATTSVPTYVAGEVLTAADLNVTNSGIPVFADSTARTNGFGGTGEKTLAEGQYAYLEDDNKTYVYDGSAWQEVGNSGLVLISSTTIGSAVSSVTVSNVFSSTYDNYKIIVSGGAASAAGALQIRLGATTTGYYYVTVRYTYAGVASNDIGSNQAIFAPVGGSSTDNLTLSCDLIAPYLAEKTSIYFNQVGPVSTSVAGAGGGFLDNTTSYTGFDLVQSTGTMTGGTIKVYGYKN